MGRSYVLSSANYTRLKNLGVAMKCSFCKKPVLVGQKIWRSRPSSSKLQHYSCYRKSFVLVD